MKDGYILPHKRAKERVIDPVETGALPAQAAVNELIAHLRSLANPENVAGMARFGISSEGTLGIPVTTLRPIARSLLKTRRTDGAWRHIVAGGLWMSGLHEARILATLVEDPALVTPEQALAWASDSDSWDITDQLCMSLLDRTPFAYSLAEEWSAAEPEFVKRAAFALMAALASHDRSDYAEERLVQFLDAIEREAHDPRNYVKKAVNWALRGIGKRSPRTHAAATECALRLAASTDRTERWVGKDAVRELQSTAVRQRLGLA